MSVAFLLLSFAHTTCLNSNIPCHLLIPKLSIQPCSKFADEKAVFREIEFYIPQLAHLIIHMDVSNRNQALEMVAMVLSQNSIHAALQLNFLFNAAMEDYQPELANGSKNAACNPFYFSRCARLVQDVERAVIYGSREMTNNSEGKIKSNDDKLDQIQRSLDSEKSMQVDGELSGQLYYKRGECVCCVCV
ncbi:hypothetical protein EON65_56195 [archaeon]|nr:MAG: hypothetical protein EON65_56195 [archaeon]